jgi:hypothetical protein
MMGFGERANETERRYRQLGHHKEIDDEAAVLTGDL